ncbi:MAG TPA: tRNA uridine-5-carboxymethylaminomethyl(34) synthesis GTPase MnmE [Caulobacteraceae bacterium]|nr:tRNA uridine-5-carboxymethylaminomethyl(34) synthesis GTPase MnmE [Caulobacteraceae bacterium]
MSDTIFALATAPGRAAVAIIRLSGPRAREALITLAAGKPAHGRARVRLLRSADGGPLDTAITLFFAAPHSYTGEDCAELHLHGGAGVVDGVTEALLGLGLRLAGPGEFTRRAFENGKLDLDQAEAIADLTDAETSAQARQALGQLEGRLGARYRTWREALVDALARLEAAVDFPDEEVPPGVAQQAKAALQRLTSDLDAALADEGRGQRVREGYRVAIVGAANSGKSSLINALAGRDAAIVTPTPGATRDIIETLLVLDGFKVLLADMAGIRRTSDPIESEGVRRARVWSEGADLRLWVVDRAEESGLWREALDLIREGDICVLNKSDLPAGADEAAAVRAAKDRDVDVISLSLLDEGGSTVEAALSVRVRQELSGAEFPAATRARHEALLREARDHLGRALSQLDEPELAAEDARLAARSLERISGRIGAEDILGRVFATFCIGK